MNDVNKMDKSVTDRKSHFLVLFIRRVVPHIVLMAIFFAYLFLGAWLFMTLEGEHADNRALEEDKDEFRDMMEMLHNCTVRSIMNSLNSYMTTNSWTSRIMTLNPGQSIVTEIPGESTVPGNPGESTVPRNPSSGDTNIPPGQGGNNPGQSSGDNQGAGGNKESNPGQGKHKCDYAMNSDEIYQHMLKKMQKMDWKIARMDSVQSGRAWTWTSAVLYSVTTITTIGKLRPFIMYVHDIVKHENSLIMV